MGLFSVVEQVDKRFLQDRFGDNDEGNLHLHPLGLRQQLRHRLLRHPLAGHRPRRLARQHRELRPPELGRAAVADPAGPEPAPQPRLPPLLPGPRRVPPRHRDQPRRDRRRDRARRRRPLGPRCPTRLPGARHAARLAVHRPPVHQQRGLAQRPSSTSSRRGRRPPLASSTSCECATTAPARSWRPCAGSIRPGPAGRGSQSHWSQYRRPLPWVLWTAARPLPTGGLPSQKGPQQRRVGVARAYPRLPEGRTRSRWVGFRRS